jgi:leader peptidase (prepilin peptidase) / N-methyltransferase
MTWIGLGLVALLGLAIGSFLNVVIYRVPAEKSVVSPPSACPHCGAGIRWFDNIPVISWVILRARCRNCAAPISVRYPIVELVTAVLFVLVGLRFLPAVEQSLVMPAVFSSLLALVAFLFLAAVSVALAAIDLDTHRLPNVITYPSFIVMAVLLSVSSLLLGDGDALLRAAIGAAALFAAYLLMALAYPGGMGLGDVKLAAVLGLSLAWLGWSELIVGAFAAFVLGGLFSIAMLALRRVGRKSGIPFGPWMLVGAFVGVLIGDDIATWYLGLFGLA